MAHQQVRLGRGGSVLEYDTLCAGQKCFFRNCHTSSFTTEDGPDESRENAALSHRPNLAQRSGILRNGACLWASLDFESGQTLHRPPALAG